MRIFGGAARSVRVRTLAVLATCTLVGTSGVAPARADSAGCVAGQWRAGATNSPDSQATRDINGVKGMIDIPVTSPRNVTSGYELSASDIFTQIDDLYFDFVQFGWVYGYTDAAHGFQPRYTAFMGEWDNGSEILRFHFGVTLTPGTSHMFELRRKEDATSPDHQKWFGFIDGVQLLKSTNTHLGGYAGTTGEVNWLCHGLRNSNVEILSDGSFGQTLKARRRSTGLWYNWAEHHDFTTHSCFVATRYYNGSSGLGATANDYSTFASTCPQN